jgi:alpha,alpha-trehalase
MMQRSLDFFTSELFHDVQMARLFTDSKTFADAVPKQNYKTAISAYNLVKNSNGFDLAVFVNSHFKMPIAPVPMDLRQQDTLLDYISHQWHALARKPDGAVFSSLIGLKHPYIVPGGRFREIYYWDSYFTSLGLAISGQVDMVKSMVKNFIDIQEHVGLIPNGNRSYYHTRTQPPVLALLLELVLQHDSDVSIDSDNPFFSKCLSAIEQEYQVWMDGENLLSDSQTSHRRVVRIDGYCLNRYWDDAATPRAESYREDIELTAHLPQAERADFYRSIRAACESGWDFSSRWLKDGETLASIHTIDILPIDLNALLYKVEHDLAEYFSKLKQTQKAQNYAQRARRRAQAIQTYLWDADAAWYFDYDFVAKQAKTTRSLAAIVPVFTGLSSQAQAAELHSGVMQDFLKEGGLLTTLTYSGQQWDAPNGWAPLNYMACKGLLDYGFDSSAKEIIRAWLKSMETHFQATGNMMEKYDVVHLHAKAGGGEYEVQEGFGWTNGVTLAFHDLLKQL